MKIRARTSEPSPAVTMVMMNAPSTFRHLRHLRHSRSRPVLNRFQQMRHRWKALDEFYTTMPLEGNIMSILAQHDLTLQEPYYCNLSPLTPLTILTIITTQSISTNPQPIPANEVPLESSHQVRIDRHVGAYLFVMLDDALAAGTTGLSTSWQVHVNFSNSTPSQINQKMPCLA